jgi:hypothetical protein
VSGRTSCASQNRDSMSNPSKQKGTGGETELRLELLGVLPRLRRTAASSVWDLEQTGGGGAVFIPLLATRPDRGEWLISMTLDTFRELLGDQGETDAIEVAIESKRYKRFAHHTIYEETFGD